MAEPVVPPQWKLLEICPLDCQGKPFLVRPLPEELLQNCPRWVRGRRELLASGCWWPLCIAGPGAKEAISRPRPQGCRDQPCPLQKPAESTLEPGREPSLPAVSLQQPLQTNLHIVPRDKSILATEQALKGGFGAKMQYIDNWHHDLDFLWKVKYASTAVPLQLLYPLPGTLFLHPQPYLHGWKQKVSDQSILYQWGLYQWDRSH